MITDKQIEQRCRYRLEKHGMRAHKINGFSEPVYHIYEINGDDSIPDDDASFFNLFGLLDYCERLAEKEKA